MTKRHLKVSISIPDGGKHAGRVDYTIDPDKVTEADREWAAGLMRSIAEHLASRRHPASLSTGNRGEK